MAKSIGTGMIPCTNALGSFIRRRRLEFNLTQEALALLLGIAQNTLSKIETGVYKRYDLLNLAKFSLVLKCDKNKLLELLPKEIEFPVGSELGQIVRAKREKAGLSIDDLALRLKTTKSAVKNFELRTSGGINYKTARKLARALRCNVSIFAPFICGRSSHKKECPGDLIRWARKKLCMTGEECARKLEITRQAFNYIELGRNTLSNDAQVEKIALIVKLDPEMLKARRQKRRLKKPKMPPSTSGGFLAQERIKLGLTREKFAILTEVSFTLLSEIEGGKRFIDEETLEKIWKVLYPPISSEEILKGA